MRRLNWSVGRMVALFVFCSAVQTVALASVPSSITVQGKLTDAAGNPISGPQGFNFKIFDAALGGTIIWPGGGGENQSLATDANGLWIGLVGAVTPLTDTVFADTSRWLEITVAGTTLPRVRLVTGPYAHRTGTVDGATGGGVTTSLTVGAANTAGLRSLAVGVSNIAGDNSLVAGSGNNANGDNCSILGGRFNSTADASWSTIGGGEEDTIRGQWNFIGGGRLNSATGQFVFIGGGVSNYTGGMHTTISGGYSNTIVPNLGGDKSTIGGGAFNLITASYSTIGGGTFDTASGTYSTVGGGNANRAQGVGATVSGGTANLAQGARAAVVGGESNFAKGLWSIAGGHGSRAMGWNSVAFGGGSDISDSNIASGSSSTVPGGARNRAAGDYSFAAGHQARAMHHGAFVWADNSGTEFSSTGNNQFLIRASGGVGIGTASPTQRLHIAGLTAGDGVMLTGSSPGYSLQTGGGAAFGEASSAGLWSQSADSGDAVVRSRSGRKLHLQSGFGAAGISLGSSGNVGIGFTDPGYKLSVNGGIWAQNGIDCLGSIYSWANLTALGDIWTSDVFRQGSGCSVVWNTCSDIRLKKNIESLQNCVDDLSRLSAIRFDWRREEFPERGFPAGRQTGLIAQEVQQVMPEAVQKNADGYLSVDYSRLVPLLVGSLKEQQNQIESLQTTIQQQQQDIDALKRALRQ